MRTLALTLSAFLLLAAGCTTPAVDDPRSTSDPPVTTPPKTSTSTTTSVSSAPPSATRDPITSTSSNPVPPTKPLTRTETFDVDWSGHMSTIWACAPNPAGGCSGPALPADDDDWQVWGNASIVAASGTLTLTWDQAYPPSLRMYAAMSTSCGESCYQGYNGTDATAGTPVELTIPVMNATAKDTVGLLLLVNYPNAMPEDVDAYGFVKAPVEFTVKGKLTLTWTV